MTQLHTRERKVAPVFMTGVDERQGIVEAIVSIFGVLDDGDDVVQPGAFAKTIAERGLRVQVLDNHRADSVLRVVGRVLSIREVARDELPTELLIRYPEATGGLWTRTQYLLDTPEGEGVFRRIASGAVREYSIGYDTLDARFEQRKRNDGSGTEAFARVLTEIRLWEYSPVVWGMNPATATVAIKSGTTAGATLPSSEAYTPVGTTPALSAATHFDRILLPSPMTEGHEKGEVSFNSMKGHTLNIKSAENQLLEAQSLLRKATEILGEGDLTDARRAEASSLREQARKIKNDADLMRQIESEAKGLIAAEIAHSKLLERGGDSRFRSFGEFLSAVVETKATGRMDDRLSRFVDSDESGESRRSRKALAGTSGAAGGFLIPEGFASQLQSVMVDQSAPLARTTRLPMASRTLTLPVVDYTQSLATGVPRQFGSVQAFYDEEGAQIEESEPKFREFTLTAHELTVYTEANNSLLADSAVSLEAFLQSNMGMLGALMWKIEYAIFRGTGVGQPRGILNSPAAITVERATDDSVEYIDLALMDEAAIPSAGLAWYASISLKSKLRTLQDDDGRYIWSDAAGGLPAMLLGYPIFFTDKLPRVGTTGDLVLADMSYYLFGDRQSATLDASAEANFRRNRTAYRLVHRHDGSPWMNSPLTLADNVTTISPFVLLGEYTP